MRNKLFKAIILVIIGIVIALALTITVSAEGRCGSEPGQPHLIKSPMPVTVSL